MLTLEEEFLELFSSSRSSNSALQSISSITSIERLDVESNILLNSESEYMFERFKS